MDNLRSLILAEQMDNTRELTRYYLSKLKEVDVYESFCLNGKNLNQHIFSKNQIIFFGNESNGFSQKVSSKIKNKITIQRINDKVESLNLATSVAIVLYELNNQIIGK